MHRNLTLISNFLNKLSGFDAFSADLLGLALQSANIMVAWKRVRSNKGVAGIDGMSIDDFPAWAGPWRSAKTPGG